MNLYISKNQDYFSAARSEILDLLPKFSRRVLEIGCGSGLTLEMLKKNGLCDETTGIELFKEAADQAINRVDVIHCLNVERDPLPVGLGKFDLILILDVLEHLVDPWSLLKHLNEEFLTDDGQMIISLPNARHFSVVLPLLIGRFTYAERGILDQTHLRFFTKKTAVELLEGASLRIKSIKSTGLDVKLNSGKINALTLNIFAGFLAIQYIFLASKEGLDKSV